MFADAPAADFGLDPSTDPVSVYNTHTTIKQPLLYTIKVGVVKNTAQEMLLVVAMLDCSNQEVRFLFDCAVYLDRKVTRFF